MGALHDSFDVIVLGAGGAGLMCAAVAGQRGKRVLLIDHADAPGKKILISGGGRCNFTNIHAGPANYLSANPHFAKSALSRYTPADFIALVDRYGIAWHEKTLGQLFCDGSARQIVALLLAECDAGRRDASARRGGRRRRPCRRPLPGHRAAAAPAALRRWSSPPAGRRSPSLARRALPMTSRGVSASRWSSRGRRWCR